MAVSGAVPPISHLMDSPVDGHGGHTTTGDRMTLGTPVPPVVPVQVLVVPPGRSPPRSLVVVVWCAQIRWGLRLPVRQAVVHRWPLRLVPVRVCPVLVVGCYRL